MGLIARTMAINEKHQYRGELGEELNAIGAKQSEYDGHDKRSGKTAKSAGNHHDESVHAYLVGQSGEYGQDRGNGDSSHSGKPCADAKNEHEDQGCVDSQRGDHVRVGDRGAHNFAQAGLVEQ